MQFINLEQINLEVKDRVVITAAIQNLGGVVSCVVPAGRSVIVSVTHSVFRSYIDKE
jgi:hypothetical protein